MSTEAVSTDLAEALSDAIREAIIDLMSCGNEVYDMVGEALLDHMGGEEIRKEVDRHIREAVQSNDVASNEFRAMEDRLNGLFGVLQIQDRRFDEIEKAMETRRSGYLAGTAHLGEMSRRLDLADAVLDATKALIDAEVKARRRDYAELRRQVRVVDEALNQFSAGLSKLQGENLSRQAKPWRRLLRYLRGFGRKGADA